MKKLLFVLIVSILALSACFPEPGNPRDINTPPVSNIIITMVATEMYIQKEIPNAGYDLYCLVEYLGNVEEVNTSYSRTAGNVPYTIFENKVVFMLNELHVSTGTKLQVVK